VEPTELLPIVVVFSLVTVETGGHALLRFLTAQDRIEEWQFPFFRAGHAHAGVLLVLALVYYLYLEKSDLSETWQWLAGIVMAVGVLAQSGGFFLHLGLGKPDETSIGTTVTRIGAVLIAIALIVLGVGLIQAL
jgi:heme/copper-type cytochrome/quinol oxidase subunit 4